MVCAVWWQSISEDKRTEKEVITQKQQQGQSPVYSFMCALKSSEARRQHSKRLEMLIWCLTSQGTEHKVYVSTKKGDLSFVFYHAFWFLWQLHSLIGIIDWKDQDDDTSATRINDGYNQASTEKRKGFVCLDLWLLFFYVENPWLSENS